MTRPLFILGPGRSGTASMARMLNQYEGIEAHHEYCNLFVQDIAVRFTMGAEDWIEVEETVDELQNIFGAACFWSEAEVFIDASHKLSWLIEPLAVLFPDAKFLHINRDGRVVASEFFNKFHGDDENSIYENTPIEHIIRWMDDPDLMRPPPDKHHLWKVPQMGQPFYEEFRTWNRFQRCAYHWVETNRVTLEGFEHIPSEFYRSVHLEDIIKDEALLGQTLTWAGIKYEHSMFEYLQTPRHVVEPVNYKMNDEQQVQFDVIAGPMMATCGYTNAEPITYEYLSKS